MTEQKEIGGKHYLRLNRYWYLMWLIINWFFYNKADLGKKAFDLEKGTIN